MQLHQNSNYIVFSYYNSHAVVRINETTLDNINQCVKLLGY